MATAIRDWIDFLAPELAGTDSGVVDLAIEAAEAELSATRWATAETDDGVDADTYYNRAVALLAAHYLTLRGRGGGTTAAVQSERVGDVAVSYAAGAASVALDATGYGQQFQAFQRSIFAGAMAIAHDTTDDED